MKQAITPPTARTRAGLGLTSGAARGLLELQVCDECGAVQYPPREICGACLSPRIAWRAQSGDGTLLGATTLRHSNEAYFSARLPLCVGLIQLDTGPTAMAYVHAGLGPAPARVRLTARLDCSGRAVLIALPPEGSLMSDEKLAREFGADPRARNILVTDAANPAGRALVRELALAGAQRIWAGMPPGAPDADWPTCAECVSLDVTSTVSVEALRPAIGEALDIVIHTAGTEPDVGAMSASDAREIEAELSVNFLGLVRLAAVLMPVIAARGPGGAWVNLHSIYALSAAPRMAGYAASQAAAHSYSMSMRAVLQRFGVRVIEVFPGLPDEEKYRELAVPRLASGVLARAVVAALRDGIEEVYPGEFAQDRLARLSSDAKALEREIAGDAP